MPVHGALMNREGSWCPVHNMQRKPGFPIANCSIKMPDLNSGLSEGALEDDSEQQQRRQQLINFGHSQWGFNNWSWAVTKQELDFVDAVNGKFTAGVVAFVSISVKSFDIHRENIGYATSTANNRGFAIYKSRKCAVTNGLRETLLSFGGGVATDLLELLENTKVEIQTPSPAPAPAPAAAPEPLSENNQNLANKPAEVKNTKNAVKKEEERAAQPQGLRSPLTVKGGPLPPAPPVAKAHPMPATLPPAAARARPPPPPPLPRPNSNDAKLEGMTEEEARAERKRRQRLAQEEFRQKQLLKNNDTDDKQELTKHSSSIDVLPMGIPTQDIVIEETADTATSADGKRKSPAPLGNTAKRRASGKLDIVQTD